MVAATQWPFFLNVKMDVIDPFQCSYKEWASERASKRENENVVVQKCLFLIFIRWLPRLLRFYI